MSLSVDVERAIGAALADATGGAWSLGRAWLERSTLCLAVESAHPGPLSLVLEARPAEPGLRAYKTVAGFALGYRGRDVPAEHRPLLDRAVAALGALLAQRGFVEEERTAESVGGPSTFPTPHHLFHLEEVPSLPAELVARYRRDGHVLVRRALLPDVVRAARPMLVAAVERAWPRDLPPVEERPDAYSQSFTQITNVGHGDPRVALFTRCRRLASLAAQLMGVAAVRLFVEDWLVKEPGSRITPWHQDEAVFPFDAEQSITCWIPLERVSEGHGLLRYARGSHAHGLFPIDNISDISEAAFARIIAEHGFPIDELPPVSVGDVSFHHGRLVHGAHPNEGRARRWVLALHMFADGARIKHVVMPTMAQLLANAAPGKAPGDLADAAVWPRLLPASPAVQLRRADAEPALHLRAVALPGDEPIDLWIDDGRIRRSPVEGARDLTSMRGFALPGLCDVHAHISYADTPDEPVSTEAWMDARRREYAVTGTLLLRDMGAVSDAICAIGDQPGLARVHPCGNMIVRFDRFPFTRTEPENLVRACEERIEQGARWVKVFADWSDDYQGRIDAGFDGDDAITYPLPSLRGAVRAVHALGGRVAAHAFTRAGAEVAIRAGVDSLEHGWGVDEVLLEELLAAGVAWAPLVGIASHMWRVAKVREDHPRAAWIEDAMARMRVTLPLAEQRGALILAGTDMFPGVTIPDEIAQLAQLGVSRRTALAGGSWAARAFLGEPLWLDGAPADLVLYERDPREDPAELLRPRLVLSGGRRVTPSLAGVRRRYCSWDEREELLREGWARSPGPVPR
jgi:imidazolonepropionase-like amidohydrolase